MGETRADGDIAAGPEAKPEGALPALKGVPRTLRAGALYALGLSLLFLVLYVAGSVYVPGVPDALLFLLLRLTRYAAFLLSAVSLAAAGFAVRRLVYAPGPANAVSLLAYFLLILLGGLLVMFSLLMVAVAAGT